MTHTFQHACMKHDLLAISWLHISAISSCVALNHRKASKGAQCCERNESQTCCKSITANCTRTHTHTVSLLSSLFLRITRAPTRISPRIHTPISKRDFSEKFHAYVAAEKGAGKCVHLYIHTHLYDGMHISQR